MSQSQGQGLRRRRDGAEAVESAICGSRKGLVIRHQGSEACELRNG